jgi:hypothetical protein
VWKALLLYFLGDHLITRHSERENSFLTFGGRKMISQPVKIGDDTVVVIPSVILSELGIREGDTLEIALNKDKMEIKKMVLKTSSPTDSSQDGEN